MGVHDSVWEEQDGPVRIDGAEPREVRDEALFSAFNLEGEDTIRVESVTPETAPYETDVEVYSRGDLVDGQRQRISEKPEIKPGREYREAMSAYERKAAQARKLVPDYDTVTAKCAEFPLHIQGQIAKLPNSPAMSYALGMRPDLREKLLAVPVGKLPATLKSWAEDLDQFFLNQNDQTSFTQVRSAQGKLRRK